MENLLSLCICGKVVTLFADTIHMAPGIIVHSALGLEEEFYALQVLRSVEKVFLLLHHAAQQRNIVLALAQDISHEVTSFGDRLLLRVSELRISVIEKLLVVLLLRRKGVQHKTDQPIL